MSTEKQEKEERGVPYKTRKQLAIDIEEAGGIEDFDKGVGQSLDNILNNSAKEKFYKQRGDPLRRKIRNLVYTQWKHFTREKYLEKVYIPLALSQAQPQDYLSDDTTNIHQSPSPAPTSKKHTPINKKASAAPDNTTNCKMSSQHPTTNNEVGELIVLKLPNGLYWLIAWVDSKLDKSILQIVVHKDKVVKRTKKPSIINPKQEAMKMLAEMGYQFASNPHHMVVASLEGTLRQIMNQRQIKNEDGWNEEVLYHFDEEVLTTIVDVNEKPDEIDYSADEKGRQRISFFVKTVHSNDMAPAGFRCRGSNSQGNASMDTDAANVEAVRLEAEAAHMAAEAARAEAIAMAEAAAREHEAARARAEQEQADRVEGMRNEMYGRLKQMAEEVQSHSDTMRKEIRGEMRDFFQQFMAQMQQQQQPAPMQVGSGASTT